jgi:hypothetical protein
MPSRYRSPVRAVMLARLRVVVTVSPLPVLPAVETTDKVPA